MADANRQLSIDSLDALNELWSSYRSEAAVPWSASRYVQVAKLCRNYGQCALANDVLLAGAIDCPKSLEI